MTGLDRVIELRRALEKIDRDMDQLVLVIVKRLEGWVLELNTEDQLFDQGIKSTGREVRPPYTPYTKLLKRIKGQPTDRVTLRDTGDFHRSFYLDYTGQAVEIKAKDPKTQELVAKYGPDIFGITDANLQFFIDDLFGPELLQEVRKLIQ